MRHDTRERTAVSCHAIKGFALMRTAVHRPHVRGGAACSRVALSRRAMAVRVSSEVQTNHRAAAVDVEMNLAINMSNCRRRLGRRRRLLH